MQQRLPPLLHQSAPSRTAGPRRGAHRGGDRGSRRPGGLLGFPLVPHHRRRALLREDFSDLYRTLKGKGLVVSLFTNGCC